MYELRRSSFGGSLIEIVLLLAVVSFFVMVVVVVYVVKTFVKYHTHKSLWIALAICIVSCIAAGLVYKLTQFNGSPVLAGIGITILLITCFVVDLKNRDTLMRENAPHLVDAVLHQKWWASEDTPLELEDDQRAA